MQRLVPILLLVLLLPVARGAAEPEEPSPWHRRGADGAVQVALYVFWSETCPHCTRARAFLDPFAEARPWLWVSSHEVSGSAENRRLFAFLAQRLGQEIQGVPTFFACGRMIAGFDTASGTGAALAALVDACHERLEREDAEGAAAAEAAVPDTRVDLPGIGRLDPGALSLPLLTLVLAGVDAFNPCAFFVLLFLLSLMVHARSRGRMLLIGGVFVFFSGLLYFVFMAAWLNLFVVLQGVGSVTLIAGLVAIGLAGLNIKDFFLFERGPSLSIPEGAKPGLFARMRGLLSAQSLPALLGATVVLALAANSYELLCTSGFPLIYTRALTLSDLSVAGRYLYLALYNAIYVMPLLAIVVAATATLGGRKLSERQGRLLKLLSGLMMLGLGLVLVLAPELLDHWLTAVALLLAALLLTAGLALLDRLWKAGDA